MPSWIARTTRLAMGFEPDDAVDDVDARLPEHTRLVDVVLLVEPGLELHERGLLFAVFGGTGEGRDDWIGLGGAIDAISMARACGSSDACLMNWTTGAERLRTDGAPGCHGRGSQ